MVKNKNLIGVHGKLLCGKDLVGQIIQYLTSGAEKKYTIQEYLDRYDKMGTFGYGYLSDYEIVKYADKLKDMVCLLIGYTREQLEDRNLKERELGEEWRVYKYDGKIYTTYEQAEKDLREYYWYDLEGTIIDQLCKIYITSYVLTPRLLTQLIGTECFRNIIHPNSWVNSTFANYKKIDNYTFVPGEYMGVCKECNISFVGAKRQYICEDCCEENKKYPSYSKWIITDVRYINELDAIKNRGGINIKIERDFEFRFPTVWEKFKNTDYDKIETYLLREDEEMHKKIYHDSEIGLDDYNDFDYVIKNNGTIEELVEQVKKIIK